VLAQGVVRGVVVNDSANIRVVPAFGGEMLANVPGGFAITANGRSPDNEWLRIDFNGQEGWIHTATLTILEGDVNSLQVADPRTIPYGGFESPRAGLSNATSPVTAKLMSGLHLRAGPSTGYVILANPFRNTIVHVTGRTASNSWVQIQFEGTLGWVAAAYLEFQNGAFISQLPIDGIVADSVPPSQKTADDYIATLKLMFERIELAQPSLDAIRAAWADAALAGRVFCHAYPARPSDYNVPNPLLAAFYPTLNPLMTDFNNAMFNVRLAIDLFIEACNQPGNGNPVGQATVSGALGVVNLADTQFADLRRRLLELIPPDRQVGPNECLLIFQSQSDILPVIQIGTIYSGSFDSTKPAVGACFDPVVGRRYQVEVLQLEGNARPFISVSPFDNPTNFIAVGGSFVDPNYAAVGPLLISTPGRHLIIISHTSGAAVEGALTSRFAYVVLDVTDLALVPALAKDPTTGNPVLSTPIFATPAFATQGSVVACPSLAFTCNQLFSCQEAQACLAAGNFSLDADGDGIPCEETLCLGS
jgi:uncharacterized protein YraI